MAEEFTRITNDDQFVSQDEFVSDVSYSTQLAAAIQMGQLNTPTQAVFDLFDLNTIDDQEDMIKMDDAKRLAPELADQIDGDISQQEFDSIRAMSRKKQLLASVMNKHNGGFLRGSVSFGGSIIAEALDPLNIGAGLATGGILNAVKGMRMVGLSTETLGVLGRSKEILSKLPEARKLRAMEIAEMSMGGKYAMTLGEGIIGNLAVEPLVYLAAQERREDYTLGEAMVNSVAGAFVMSTGIFGIRYGLSKTVNFVKTHDEGLQSFIKATTGRVKSDKRTGAVEITEQMIKDRYNVENAYNKADPLNLEGRTVHVGTKGKSADAKVKHVTNLTARWGSVVDFSDIDMVRAKTKGNVHEFEINGKINEGTVIDLDAKMDDQMRSDLQFIADQEGLNVQLKKDMTGWEVFEEFFNAVAEYNEGRAGDTSPGKPFLRMIQERMVNELNIKAAVGNGKNQVDLKDVDGVVDHNIYMIFDEGVLSKRKVETSRSRTGKIKYKPGKKAVPATDFVRSLTTNLDDDINQWDYRADDAQTIKEFREKPDKVQGERKVMDIEKDTQVDKETVEFLKANGLDVDPEAKTLIDELDAGERGILDAIKEVIGCRFGKGV